MPLADLAEGSRGDADHLPRHAGAAAARDHLAGVVGDRRGGPRLRRVHDQRRARQAVAHAVAGGCTSTSTTRGCSSSARALPAYRPPVDHRLMLAGAQPIAARRRRRRSTLRYLTPHSKWSIHSEYQDNLHMLTLFRGGSGLWMSPQDAEAIGVARQRLGRGATTATASSSRARSSRTACRAGRVPDVPLQGPPDRHAALARSTGAAAAPRTR